jgi:GNAT superfamily N-acetyltransferase
MGGVSYRIALLADVPHLVEAAGELRWREWGRPPEPTDREFWVDTTAAEAGRSGLPVTWVAVAEDGTVAGVVGLAAHDLDEIRDERTPWVAGMVVAPAYRMRGVGRALLADLEAYAKNEGHDRLWVVTEHAAAYYRACGYAPTEELTLESGERATVLVRVLDTP